MQQFSNTQTHLTQRQVAPTVRLSQVLHLCSGEIVSAIADSRDTFEDRAVFGPVTTGIMDANPAKWLASKIGDAAAAIEASGMEARPVFVPAPMAAFAHSNTAIAADAAIRQTRLLPQEVCVEFQDAALVSGGTDCLRRVESLRRKGFRVSIDARKAWNAEPPRAIHLLLDTIRVRASDLETQDDLRDKIEAAAGAGVAIIAEGARWRDGEMLASMGVEFAVLPRTDA